MCEVKTDPGALVSLFSVRRECKDNLGRGESSIRVRGGGRGKISGPVSLGTW